MVEAPDTIAMSGNPRKKYLLSVHEAQDTKIIIGVFSSLKRAKEAIRTHATRMARESDVRIDDVVLILNESEAVVRMKDTVVQYDWKTLQEDELLPRLHVVF